jgi:hypothetical protein
MIEIIQNKGTGAGGANTNKNGNKFEEKTSNRKRLLEMGFIENVTQKHNQRFEYLSKTLEDKNIIFVEQHNFQKYMNHVYNVELFRNPDEAYIIEYNNGRKIIKILEKKEQNTKGSVETKLWSGPSLKRKYEIVLDGLFEVEYCFCVSAFLQKKMLSDDKKYIILNTILQENNIPVLFGDDEDYYISLDNWINNSL